MRIRSLKEHNLVKFGSSSWSQNYWEQLIKQKEIGLIFFIFLPWLLLFLLLVLMINESISWLQGRSNKCFWVFPSSFQLYSPRWHLRVWSNIPGWNISGDFISHVEIIPIKLIIMGILSLRYKILSWFLSLVTSKLSWDIKVSLQCEYYNLRITLQFNKVEWINNNTYK